MRSAWDRLNGETVFMYVLGVGADKHRALPVESWAALQPFYGTVAGLRFNNADLPEPLHTLVDKVATSPTKVTDADLAAPLAAGLSEDEIFELVICAAVGQSARQYEAGLAALADAEGG